MPAHFTSVRFQNYKAFKSLSVSLSEFNIVVGPNNAGKSTVIGAFRILAEGLRRAERLNPRHIDSIAYRGWGYDVTLDDLPVSTENVFTDYDDSQPASIDFGLSNGSKLRLIFPENGACFMVCETGGRSIRSVSDFRRAFNVGLSFVPVLGPVEHEEGLYQPEAARRALLSHRASRNFRNIWYHYPQGFDEFQEIVRQTWPGMDILPPEPSAGGRSGRLHMFCPEDRMAREIFWAGFGFQVWCQMLTFITKAKPGSLLVIDEPDIYLHSDLQRQLVHLLRKRDGDVLIATHSTEMLAEAEPSDIIVINKKWAAARRIKQPLQLQGVFSELGSSLNPLLTQLAKTRKVLFVEGGDFSLIAAFARKLGAAKVANGAAFAVVPSKGFNSSRIADFSEGMQSTLGLPIERAVVFDRDYRPDSAVERTRNELGRDAAFVHIHDRKEIENYLLVPDALDRAVVSRIAERRSRGGSAVDFIDSCSSLLLGIADDLKGDVLGQHCSQSAQELRSSSPRVDYATVSAEVYRNFEANWHDEMFRLSVIPGKLAFRKLNELLQSRYSVSLTPNQVVAAMRASEVPEGIRDLVTGLHDFAGEADRRQAA